MERKFHLISNKDKQDLPAERIENEEEAKQQDDRTNKKPHTTGTVWL